MKRMIKGLIQQIRSNRLPEVSERISVNVSYESAQTIGSIEIELPITDAADLHVGQAVTITIESV